MKPCVLLTFCQLLGHSKARTGRGLACTVSFTCVNDLQVHFQWLQHANGMVHPTGSLFHMSSLACIDVRNTIHLSWCHLSAAGDARPSARPTSRAAPTTRRLGRRALRAPAGRGAAESRPQARGRGRGRAAGIALGPIANAGSCAWMLGNAHPPAFPGPPACARAAGRCRRAACIDLNAPRPVAAAGRGRGARVVCCMMRIICELTQLSSTQCQCHWSPRSHRQSHCDTYIRGTQPARRQWQKPH